MRIATPKSRNSWRSLGALGGSLAREYDGSVSNAIPHSSVEPLSVLGAATSGVKSALGHRKSQLMLNSTKSLLTRYSIKKTKKEETLDPKLVAAVEAKLRALDVDSDILTSGLEAS
jgi:hypothetical protein